jgi:hypothetical protein
MVKKLGRAFNDAVGRIGRRGTCLLLVACFFMCVVALALHHHDVPLQLKSCSICKAKGSLSWALGKIKADLPAMAATAVLRPKGLCDGVLRLSQDSPNLIVTPSLSNPFLNKAPPVLS